MLTFDRASELFIYDKKTGELLWRESRGNKRAGDVAGCINGHGYFQVSADNRRYMNHRIVWLLVTGSWPKNHIDHKNGDKTDNRFKNLRDVEQSVNVQNQRRAQKHNKNGFLGTYQRGGGRWIARIRINGEIKHLGTFDTAKEGHDAYIKAKRRFHGGCTI